MNGIRHFFLLVSMLIATVSLNAATVDTVITYSPSMKKNIKAVVITPAGYARGKAFAVVYLLHGYSDAYNDWVTKVADIKTLADNYGFMIVCPDGQYSSWYLDSPIDSTWKFETYISTELVNWIDSHYKTIHAPSGRAITGLSMGGHGALYLAFKHQDVFGAAGSMSGGVDIRPFPNNWDLAKRLGAYSTHPENWEQNSVINLTYRLTPGSLNIIIDCGTEDFFYSVNQRLHQKLLDNNIPHDYISRPGGHSWSYWTNAIGYQLLFMHNFFEHLPGKEKEE
jgi:S-formylglutathione hydrolase FrmB